MTLKKCILTDNDCYKKGKKMKNNKPTGIVVHSTGADNPYIKRYVQPLKTDSEYGVIIDDIGINTYNNHWNKSGGNKCVHAFIGKTAKGTAAVYQTLPFDYCCWGCGSGAKGSYNSDPDARVQFEICEDNLKDERYFREVFAVAVEFCAYICGKYELTIDKICSHKEAHNAGYASNHGDPDHWMSVYGKSMNDFRVEVSKLLSINPAAVTPDKVSVTTVAAAKVTKGDLVELSGNAVYYSGKSIPSWVLGKRWYVKLEPIGERAVIDISEDGKNSICSPINIKYLTVVSPAGKQVDTNKTDGLYRVRVTAPLLNIRKGPGTNYTISGQIKDSGVYTIIEEAGGTGAEIWGKLISGAGWISLDYCKKV